MLLRVLPYTGLLFTALLAGCGAPVLHHMDGRDLGPDFRIAAIERGWIAVDSCSGGLHAVVELEVDSLNMDRVPQTLTGIGRTLRAWGPEPQQVSITGPYCAATPAGERMAMGGLGPGSGGAARPSYCTPTYVVHAQYLLRSLPRDDRQVVLHHLGRRIAVTWEH